MAACTELGLCRLQGAGAHIRALFAEVKGVFVSFWSQDRRRNNFPHSSVISHLNSSTSPRYSRRAWQASPALGLSRHRWWALGPPSQGSHPLPFLWKWTEGLHSCCSQGTSLVCSRSHRLGSCPLPELFWIQVGACPRGDSWHNCKMRTRWGREGHLNPLCFYFQLQV